MTKAYDPAFPYRQFIPPDFDEISGDIIKAFDRYLPGLTKREYFAAMAMQGLCLKTDAHYEAGPCTAAIVKRSILIADALIAELGKEE